MKQLKMLVTVAIVLSSVGSAFAATGDAVSATSSTGTTTDLTALNVPSAPVFVKKDATSVTISWPKVAAASAYIVKYSNKSVAASKELNPVYDNETSPVTETGATISGLTTGSTYYFAVVAVNSEGDESDSLSDELAVTLSATTTSSSGTVAATETSSGAVATAATGATSEFSVVSATGVTTKEMYVEFSSPLGTTPIVLKIVKVSNSAAVAVASVTVDKEKPTRAIVALSTALEPSTGYSVTVVSAKDASNATIPEGIKAVTEFATAIDLPGAMNAAPSETASGAVSASGSTGAVTPTTEVKTGPQETLIVVLALLFSLGIVYAVRRKAR